MVTLSLLLFLPVSLLAAPHDKGFVLSYDGEEPHPTEPYVSFLETMMQPKWHLYQAPIAAQLREFNDPHPLSNDVDARVMEFIKTEVIEETLWSEVGKEDEKENHRRRAVHVGPDQNSAFLYYANGRYVCPYGRVGYSVYWNYHLKETSHGDWEKVENGTEPSCSFTLSVSDIKAFRLVPGTPDKEMNLTAVNEYVKTHNVTVRVVRGDDWPNIHGSNKTQNPTYVALPTPIDPDFAYPEIFKAFTNITDLEGIIRFHGRCKHVKDLNVTFYKDLCPSSRFYGGERAFWGKTHENWFRVPMHTPDRTALNMNLLLRNIFPSDEFVCKEIDLVPGRMHTQHQAFVQDKDIPSLFSISHVKLRVNYERYHEFVWGRRWFAGQEEEKQEPMFTRHLDQADLILSRMKGHQYVEHLTEADQWRIKQNRMEDCELFDNVNWRYRKFVAPWYECLYLWLFPAYWHHDCSDA